MLYFPVYEKVKKTMIEQSGWEHGSIKLYALSAAVGGLFAGGITCSLTCPFWVLRTRMQAEVFRETSKAGYNARYPRNLLKAIKIIQKEEGTRALY
jgi:hypothetical protein